jgi:glycosyltransferase involved in cell wall biosynthesis
MGAVSFSLDKLLVKALKEVLPINTLVETGTFRGDTVAEMQPYFNKVVSIELSETLSNEAVKRFKNNKHVKIMHGNSIDALSDIYPEIQAEAVLYWLDAHWCVANDTAGESSQCPLIGELQAIGVLNTQSVVLIDDARLFLAPPLAPHEISQWPSFNQIVVQLMSMSKKHEFMVVNDVIAFFPIQAKDMMFKYAQTCGIDWLNASNSLKQNGIMMQQLKEKESFIHQQNKDIIERDKVITEKDKSISEKENLIKEQIRVLTNYHQLFFPFKPFLSVFRNVRKILKLIKKTAPPRLKKTMLPRLGNLNQYSPRPLNTDQISCKIRSLANTPKISIVTPSYQQGAFVERTILSVLNQQYPNLEYFVQDGGSTDTTIEVLKKYEEKLTKWTSKKDNGQSQAINLGFSCASGEIMAWLNSDDLLLPGALNIVVDYFNRHPEIDVIYGNRLLIDENDMNIGRWILPGHDGNVLEWVDYIPQETMFWRRSIWEKAGGKIDETFKFAMDWDLLVRFKEVNAKFAHLPCFLGAFRIHELQKTSSVINQVGLEEMNRIRMRLLGRIPSNKEIRRKATPYMLKHIAADILYRIKIRLGRSEYKV